MIAIEKHRADWEYKRLQFGASILNSNVDKKIVEGEIPVKLCNYVDVYYNDIISENLDFMDGSATEDEIDKFKVREGDVIITKDSESADDIGIPAYVEKDLENVVCGYHLAMFKPFRDQLNGKFLLYFLNSKIAQKNFELGANGVTRFGLGRNAIKTLQVPYPKPSEQTLIARFLDQKTSQIDGLIEQKEKLLKLLAEKRTAIITQAVTKGLDPNVEMKDSGIDWLGGVPKHWIVCHLKHKAKITYGVGGEIDTTLTEGIRLLSLPNVNKEGTFILDHIPFSDLSLEEADELLLKKGDLLFNWRNGSSDHLGKTAYFDLDGEYLHVSFLLRLRFDQELNNSKFFQYMLHSLRLTGFFTSSKAGVNNTFNQNELRNLWVMVPPLEEQNVIADFISSKIIKIDNVRVEIQKGIEKLREYREALITAAVTGQIDVSSTSSDTQDVEALETASNHDPSSTSGSSTEPQ